MAVAKHEYQQPSAPSSPFPEPAWGPIRPLGTEGTLRLQRHLPLSSAPSALCHCPQLPTAAHVLRDVGAGGAGASVADGGTASAPRTVPGPDQELPGWPARHPSAHAPSSPGSHSPCPPRPPSLRAPNLCGLQSGLFQAPPWQSPQTPGQEVGERGPGGQAAAQSMWPGRRWAQQGQRGAQRRQGPLAGQARPRRGL